MEYCGVGQLNRATGWGLLLAGLGVAATLDPWIMGATDSSTYAEGLRPIVRHAQGVTLAMAFLQLAMVLWPRLKGRGGPRRGRTVRGKGPSRPERRRRPGPR